MLVCANKPQIKSNSPIKPIKWSQHEINKLLFKIKNHCPSPTTDLDRSRLKNKCI